MERKTKSIQYEVPVLANRRIVDLLLLVVEQVALVPQFVRVVVVIVAIPQEEVEQE